MGIRSGLGFEFRNHVEKRRDKRTTRILISILITFLVFGIYFGLIYQNLTILVAGILVMICSAVLRISDLLLRIQRRIEEQTYEDLRSDIFHRT